jgi:hypothetical protein
MGMAEQENRNQRSVGEHCQHRRARLQERLGASQPRSGDGPDDHTGEGDERQRKMHPAESVGRCAHRVVREERERAGRERPDDQAT